MDVMLVFWALSAALVLGVMMLFVVMIARGMDKPIAPKAEASEQLAKVMASLGAKPEAGSAPSETASSDKSSNPLQGVVAIGAALAVLGGVVAFIGDFTEDDAPPEVSEISAGDLGGTIVSARDSDPVVLIVPGSGPTDRDGNSPLGVKTDAYRLLAEGLAEERVASVRIDKRGMFGSAAAGDPNAVTPADYVADIHAWIDTIKAARGSECVFLLGHSEGALMVSLAAQGRKDVCGLILLAGMGRTMGDVIRQQLRDNPANAPVLDEAMSALAELAAGRRVDVSAMHPALVPLFAPQVQDYLISVINLDPVEELNRANTDTLILQGKTDLQVTVEDARLLDRARKTKMRLVDDMNHVLKEAPADRAANLATYAAPSLPLAPRLVGRIEDFVKDND
jgi:alpha-beta hydrolase superfamily lysophospholipase